MSKVVSLRLKDPQLQRLQRAARRFGRTPSETAAILVDEATRQLEFAEIEFRDSPVGRQAYVRGSRLAAWQVAWLARDFKGSAEKVAEHLEWPLARVQAALAYAAAFPEEIRLAIEDNDSYDFEKLSRMLPGTMRFEPRPRKRSKRAAPAAR